MPLLTILCGGQSRRMGEDKARLSIAGETLLHRHIRLAQSLGLTPQVASGGTNYDLPVDVVRVVDQLPGRAGALSALAGALTAAALRGASGTYLLPVDTLVTPAELLAVLREKWPAPAIMVVRDGRPQPLLAWYSCTLLPRLEEWLTSGVRQMMPLAALPTVRQVAMPAEWYGRDNFNTPAEWLAAKQIFTGDAR